MSHTEWVLVILTTAIILLCAVLYYFYMRLNSLETKWDKHIKLREDFYKSLADPTKIEADFEKWAHLREMRDANRTTMPRNDGATPAKVYRPKMRGAKPANWRLQRPR